MRLQGLHLVSETNSAIEAPSRMEEGVFECASLLQLPSQFQHSSPSQLIKASSRISLITRQVEILNGDS